MNERFWALRRSRGITQQQLADQTGIDQADISRIERGWIPPAKLQQALAAALDTTVEALFHTKQEVAS